MRGSVFTIIAILIVLAGLNSCSTEVELNAPYDNRSVVYALLDAQADTQFVKLTKTFLGEGNNLEYAQVRDSSEYPFSVFETLEIEEVVNGNVVNTFPLDSITITNKEINGIFYAPRQTLYYFETPDGGLNIDSDYRLVVVFNNGEDPLLAETDLVETEFTPDGVNSANVLLPNPFITNMNEFANINSVDNNTFPTINFRWETTDNAALYEARFRFYYTEIEYTNDNFTTPISSELKSIDWALGQYKPSSTAGNEEFAVQVSGETFFNNIRTQIDPIPEDRYIRRFVGYLLPDEDAPQPAFDFLLSVANEELEIFIDVTSPVTGVIQERPSYTNVANGLGLFASKSTQGVYERIPQIYTMEYLHSMFELVNGQQLSYQFWSRDPRFSMQDFYTED